MNLLPVSSPKSKKFEVGLLGLPAFGITNNFQVLIAGGIIAFRYADTEAKLIV